MYVVGDDGIVVDAVAFFQDIGILAIVDFEDAFQYIDELLPLRVSESTKSTPSSLGATSIRNGSIWRPDLSCDREWYSMCLRALLSLLLKPMLFVSLLSFLRQMTGPSSD